VKRLVAGDTWHNPAGMPHQLVCADAGTVVEASTHDDPNDNYRVAPGDSQA
jgi:quercetin dioxygenase-like cupin family protein